MSLRIYNTLSRKKEPFRPLRKNQVRMYVCGPTVYHDIHVGNARPMVFFDLVYRYLKFKGYPVTFVRNITDIDDKIIRRGQEEKRDPSDIAKRYTAAFEEVMLALGVSTPDHSPKATEHIPRMVEWIERLIQKGVAYNVSGEVLFSIEKFRRYGKLSKKRTEDLIAGARVEVSQHKKNPIDFVLWKPSKPGEPSWESPWGPGRPGWHLECSVMSTHYLGPSFDIHGGGADLIFPHHENEIAQSESYTGRRFVKYWIHNGMLVLGKEKMSKSLGNMVTVREFLEKYPAELLRFILLSNHYRSSLEFSDRVIKKGILALEKIYKTKLKLEKRLHALEKGGGYFPEGASATLPAREGNVSPPFHRSVKGFWKKFEEALDDDFNTAKAFGHLFDLVRLANRFLSQKSVISRPKAERSRLSVGASTSSSNKDKTAVSGCLDIFSNIGKLTGLFEQDPEKFLGSLREKMGSRATLSVEEIEKWIERRNQARVQKDWKKADEIRAHLLKHNILLEDMPTGTQWKHAYSKS